MQKTVVKTPHLRGLTARSAALMLAVWTGVGIVAQTTGVFAAVSRFLTEPLELSARAALGQSPRIDAKLKIFNLDDSTFAHLRRPALSGGQWAGIIRSLIKAKPRAIVTTHMFGTGEMQDDDGALGQALAETQRRGIDVIAGVFAYPGEIQYREALDLNLFSFINSNKAIASRAKDLRGWRVYGPDAAAARQFTRLGHQGYEGDGRAALMVRVADQTLVPHLALAVAHNLRVIDDGISVDGVDVPLDRNGRTRINLLPAKELAARTKSLKALLKDADAQAPARYVDDGDVVLLLMDMYTGKVNFAPTPKGPVPGGYLWAAVLNSVLSQQWILEFGDALPAILLAPFIGAAFGIVAESWTFGLGLVCGIMLAAAAGLLSFALRAVALPWLPMTLLASAASLSFFMLKGHIRQLHARSRQIAADKEQAKLAAIVRTAQMFAHDVRKPFSLLNMAIAAIKREANPARAGALLASLAPELARAMSSVEGMIKDIMEIDSQATLDLKETDIAQLVKQAMKDVLAVRTKANVLVSYRMRHTLPAAVDAARLMRAITNILDNAVHATGGKGRLWIATEEVLDQGRCFIQLVIGNSGSFVPSDDRVRIFEAFFTKGKKDGTGLGLAIAHKIVTAHGGRIWCDSAQEIGTEFFLTLPVAEATPAEMPKFNNAVVVALATDDIGVQAPVDSPLHKALYAVVDDNAFVLEAWEMVAREESIVTFASPEEFLNKITREPQFLAGLAAMVTDFHFAGSPLDGIELARLVKEKRPNLPIFLSTDGEVEYLPGDGIDAKIEKEPLPFADLLKKKKKTA